MADHGNAQAQLDQDRDRNNQKLKSRFEHIFRKYEHDFTGIGDEFDIHTDQIVVNNGHLEYMRNEADSGTTASSKFVKTFREKLAHEDESITSEDDEDEEDQDDGSTAGSDTEVEEADASEVVSQHTPRLPQLFKLLAGEGTSQEPLEVPDDEESENDSVPETISRHQTPAAVDALRTTKRSSSAEALARSKRPMADDDTVHALGMSIATQLAKLMGASSRKKPKKKATVMHGATDPVWDYPELKQTSKTKRKRSISPVPPPQLSSSPQTTSPEGRSLWAATGSTQHGKRRRRDDTSNAVKLKARKYGNATDSHASKRCWNCSLTRSPSWRRGPHGQDLCLPCGQYYEHHGRMKGFDSATPPIDDQEQTAVPTSRNVEDPETVTDTDDSLALGEDAEHIQYDEETHHGDKTPEYVPGFEDDGPSTPSIPYQANTSRPMISSATKRKVASKWTIEEDALLIKLKERDRLSWDAIALHFPHRTTFTIQKSYSARLKGVDCPGRTLYNAQIENTAADVEAELESETDVDDDDDHDLGWSAQQDELLVALRDVDELEWAEIADLLPGHDPKAVERRYVLLTSSTRNESASDFGSRKQTDVSFAGDTVATQPDHLALPIKCSRDHLARRSLPASMPSSSRKSGFGNALLRQALGNSHRRRSDMDGIPRHAPPTASHSTSRNTDSYGHAQEHSTGHDDSAEVRRAFVMGSHGKRRRTSRGTSADAERDAREALINSFGDESQLSDVTINDDALELARPPDLSWRQIVDSAFTSTNSTSMSNQDLFAWIEANYGYYSTAPRAWKNFVREELRANDKYELDTARKRNSVWRVKEESVDHAQDNTQRPADVSLETAAVNDIDTSGISDSGALETIDSTPPQQTSRSVPRHVSFSPVVTVSTPVPVGRKRPRGKPQKQGLQPSPSAAESSAVLEIPDSDPVDAPTCSPELGTEHNLTAEATLDIDREHNSSASPARELQSGKAKLKMPSFSASGNDSTKSPSSPARTERDSPASIFKTPKQPGRSKMSDSARRHSTPIINHKFMTPNADTRKRVVETPLRELQDPDEDELAG